MANVTTDLEEPPSLVADTTESPNIRVQLQKPPGWQFWQGSWGERGLGPLLRKIGIRSSPTEAGGSFFNQPVWLVRRALPDLIVDGDPEDPNAVIVHDATEQTVQEIARCFRGARVIGTAPIHEGHEKMVSDR